MYFMRTVLFWVITQQCDSLCNDPEELGSHLLCSGSLVSHMCVSYCNDLIQVKALNEDHFTL